jgi:hypothetical protein
VAGAGVTIDELESAYNTTSVRGARCVQLTVPHKTRGCRVRLFGRTGPYAVEIAYVTDRGTVGWWEVYKIRRVVAEARKREAAEQ